MKLAATLALYGGGTGSGCRGDNCGRKSGGKATFVDKFDKSYDKEKPNYQYAEMPVSAITANPFTRRIPATVDKYVKLLKAGKPIGTLVVDPPWKGSTSIRDGHHRWEALKLLGIKMARVAYVPDEELNNPDHSFDIKAGGPGSGPNAPCPQCGPHGGEKKEEPGTGRGVMRGPAGLPAPTPIPYVGHPASHQEQEVERRHNEQNKLNSAEMSRYREKLKEMSVSHQATEAETKNYKLLEEGDRVMLMKPIAGKNTATGSPRTFPMGAEAIIQKTVPRVGSSPAMALVKVGQHGSEEFTNIEDVYLLRKAEGHQIEVQPVPDSKIAKTYTTSDGTSVTVLKPEASGFDRDLRTVGTNGAHSLKGSFSQELDTTYLRQSIPEVRAPLLQDPNYRCTVHFAQSEEGRATNDPLRGTNVFVYRRKDRGTVEIQEVKTGMYGETEYMHSKMYRRPRPAATYLNKRYGIAETP